MSSQPTSLLQKAAPASADPSPPSLARARAGEATRQKNQALLQAVIAKSLPQVQEALSQGANPDFAHLGESAMLEAARLGQVEIIRALAAAGGQIDFAPPRGMTPLMMASRNANLPAMRALLELNADPNAQTGARACAGFAIGTSRALGMTRKPPEKHAQALTLLLEFGLSLNTKISGESLMEFCITYAAAPCMQALLNAGADPNARHRHGLTPLLAVCCTRGLYDCAKVLLGAGADPNAPDPKNLRTPLIICAKRGDAPLLATLCAAGADPFAVEKTGKTAWDFAVASKSQRAIDTLGAHIESAHLRALLPMPESATAAPRL